MRLIYIFLFLFIFGSTTLKSQSIRNELSSIKLKAHEKYALVKFSKKEVASFSEEKKKQFLQKEGVLLFIPTPIKKIIKDTITFELEYNSDSTSCINKNIHSFSFEKILTVIPSIAEKNCLSIDTSTGNKVYQIQIIEIENIPENITITSSLTCEAFENEIKEETIVRENTIFIQPELKWLSLNEWNPKNKIKIEGGLMDSAFKDKEGNYYIIFEAGYYSKIRQVLCTSCKRGESLVIDLQRELLKRGYNVDLNDKIDAKTKMALIQFQKDNNLHQGNLNMETLRFLGIKY